jgi:hypothetical protein
VGATAGRSGGILFLAARVGLGTFLREVLEDEPVHFGQIRDRRHVARPLQILLITFLSFSLISLMGSLTWAS